MSKQSEDSETIQDFQSCMDYHLEGVLAGFDQFPEMPLHHYTDGAGFLGIITTGSVRATHYRYLNDSEELLLGERIVGDVAKDMAAAKGTSSRHREILVRFARKHHAHSVTKVTEVFVASFSEVRNQLSQWRAYGGNGGGYALGLSSVKLDHGPLEESDMTVGLYKCEYGEDAFRQQVGHAFGRVLAAIDGCASAFGFSDKELAQLATVHFLRAMMAFVPKLKHAAFNEEREWRLVAFPHPGKESLIEYRACPKRGVVPFVTVPLCSPGAQLDLSEVYVGPTQDPEAGCKTAQLLLRKLGYPNVESTVKSSAMPYRG